MHRNEMHASGGQRPPSTTDATPAATERSAGDSRQGERRGGRLVRLTTSCPRCGSRPALRVTEDLVRGVGAPEEATRIGTYQCHRRGCGTIYDLFLDVRRLEMEIEPGGSP